MLLNRVTSLFGFHVQPVECSWNRNMLICIGVRIIVHVIDTCCNGLGFMRIRMIKTFIGSNMGMIGIRLTVN